MKKKTWKRIRVRPNKILIALILVTSLMGMSYGAWSDQLNISGSITIASTEPPEPPPDYKIVGDIMIADEWPHSIWAGGRECMHMELEGYCGMGEYCTYEEYGKGLTMRYKVENTSNEKMTLMAQGIEGTAEIILMRMETDALSKDGCFMTAEVSSIQQQVIKRNDKYVEEKPVQGLDIVIEPGEECVIEATIGNFQTPFNNVDGIPSCWEFDVKNKFKEDYNPNTVSQNFKAVASMNMSINYKLGNKQQKDPIIREIQNQILTVSPEYGRGMMGVLQTTPSAIIITPPGPTIPPAITLPEITTSPGINIVPEPENLPAPSELSMEESQLIGIEIQDD